MESQVFACEPQVDRNRVPIKVSIASMGMIPVPDEVIQGWPQAFVVTFPFRLLAWQVTSPATETLIE